MTSTRNIRHAIKSFIPIWLSDRPSLKTGFNLIYSVALAADMLVEQYFQGTDAPLPGVGTPTALPLIGDGRGLLKGTLETDDAYAVRLQAWIDTWTDAGKPETFVQLLQGYLGNNFKVRLIDRAGLFVTAETNGTTSEATDALWNWDSAAVPSRSTWWSDVWLVIYVTDSRWPTYASFSDPGWLAAWGASGNGTGLGHAVPRDVVDGVYRILRAFKGAHTWITDVIWTNDPYRYTPGALGGIPNGTWGAWSANIAGVQTQTRISSSPGHYHRHWIPGVGG